MREEKTQVAEPLLKTATRLLTVLRAIGQLRSATILELHRSCGIPRPTLYRIVETLCATGYVQRHADHTYRLTFRVRALSDSFNDEEWVRDISAPILDGLRKKVLWPTELATFDGDAMVLRETTRRDSPLTIDRGTTGLRLPMLDTAHGRCYLAFSPAPLRRQILETLLRSGAASTEEIAAIEPSFAEISRRGYAARYRGNDNDTGSIAVPVVFRERVLGCVAITFIASALKPEEAARRHLADIVAAARLIEERLASEGDLPISP